MTNWHDPGLEAAQTLALIKLVHVVAGVYIWEFVLNIDYEYSIITGNRKINLSAPLYLTCRWSTLLNIMIQLMNFDTTSDGINCEAWAILNLVFIHFAFQSASCLIILRLYALWERKGIVLVVAFSTLLAHTVACLYVVAIIRAHRNGTVCLDNHIVHYRITSLASYITDLVLLALMVFGVLRWKEAHLTGGIWRLMYTQGLIYVAASTLAYTPSTIFLLLNLNETMDAMFLVLSLTIMSICSLRMYRGLVDSDTLNATVQGVVGTARAASTIRFAGPDHRDENTPHTEGAVPDRFPTAKPK